MKSKQIVLASRPIGFPTTKNLRIEEKITGGLKEGEVLLRSLYISVDPYMRGRMNESRSYAAAYQVGQPVIGGNVSRVVESKSNLLSEGDMVTADLPWAVHNVADAVKLRKIEPDSLIPPSYYLGILGMPGLTAYFGMMDIAKPKPGETVIVSGAAGAVGLVAGQIAKMNGCTVVGITGSDEKCSILKNEFAFDHVLNYKTAKPVKKVVAAACPAGADIYFDNVGGDVTEGVFDNLNFHSRVIVCGQISQYNNTRLNMVVDILPKVLGRSILIKGFIVRNYSDRYEEGLSALFGWVKEGSLKYRETIVKGFDELPETFLGLFTGKNVGKMLVEIE